jgi:hypothetical protein
MASTLEQDLLKKTVVELRTILRQGGQPVGGTKSTLVQRIMETNLYTSPPPPALPQTVAPNLEQDLAKKTVAELKTILRQVGALLSGNKSILIQRIIEMNLYPPLPPPATPAEIATREEEIKCCRIFEFIKTTFHETDFDRACAMKVDWAASENYQYFLRLQSAELDQTDLPMLSILENLVQLILADKINTMDKEDMFTIRPDGFTLMEGKVVLMVPDVPVSSTAPVPSTAHTGEPIYDPAHVFDETIQLREALHEFICDNFDINDFLRACYMGHLRWAWDTTYEDFKQYQTSELAQMDFPMLSCLNNFARRIQENKIDMIHKLSMIRTSSDGFILIDGKVVITMPR